MEGHYLLWRPLTEEDEEENINIFYQSDMKISNFA